MQSLGRKIVNFLGMTTLGQKTSSNSLSVVPASDFLGQRSRADSLSVTLSSEEELNVTVTPKSSAFTAFRGLSTGIKEDLIASDRGSGLPSQYLKVFASPVLPATSPELLDGSSTASIEAYFRGSVMTEFPKYFFVPFGEENYSKFSLYFEETLDVSLNVAVYGLHNNIYYEDYSPQIMADIWGDRLLPLSPTTVYAKEISANVSTRLNFVSDGAYQQIMIVATPSAEPTSGYWTMILSAQT